MTRWTRILTCFGLALVTVACASSKPQVAEVAAPQVAFPALDWPEVEAAMNQGGVLVDSRRASSYAEGHIPGAINVPCKDEAAYDRLPSEKDTQLIFYCGGPQCRARSIGAAAAKAKGYTRVAEYTGGYPDWLKRHGKL